MHPRPALMPTLSAAAGTVTQIFPPALANRDVLTLQPNLSPILTLMYVRIIPSGMSKYQRNILLSDQVHLITYCPVIHCTYLMWLPAQAEQSIVMLISNSSILDQCFVFNWISSSLQVVLQLLLFNLWVYCPDVY